MLKFILKQLRNWIPILISILICTFLLCVYVPGRFEDQESEISNLGTATLYQDKLQAPVFYVELNSLNWSKEIFDINGQASRNLSKVILNYTGSIDTVQAHINRLKQFEIILTQSYVAKSISANVFKNDIDQLRKLYDQDELPIDISGFNSAKAKVLLSPINRVVAHDNAWKRWIPMLHWIGADNLFHQWLGQIIEGSWGYSKVNNQPVIQRIGKAFNQTLILAMVSLVLALLAIPLSIILFQKNNPWKNGLIKLLRASLAVPKFIWALSLIFVLAKLFNWMDPLVFKQIQRGYSNAYVWYVIPAIAMVMPFIAYLYDQIAHQLDIEFKKDYVQTAFAKGMSKSKVIRKHVLKNSLFPFITTYTHLIPALLAGSVLVERIFGIPGIGDLLVESVMNRDFQVVIGITFIMSLIISFSYLLGDILYQLLDPKVNLYEV